MKSLIILCLVIFLLLLPIRASAHLPGQPSFFKINGKYSELYPVLSTSVPTFMLPQDISPENYLVNTPIDFEIDTEKMQIPLEIVDDTYFEWNFGDGKKGEGLKNTHVYQKMGSYELAITALTPDMSDPQLIQSVMLHILPNSSYTLPQAIIQVNGKRTTDPLTDIKELSFLDQIELNGSSSKALSSKIQSYYWDLGDEQSSKNPVVKHFYENNYYMVFPILRVVDENGFISDTFIQINNTTRSTNPSDLRSKNTILSLPFILIIIFITIVIISIYIFFNRAFLKRT